MTKVSPDFRYLPDCFKDPKHQSSKAWEGVVFLAHFDKRTYRPIPKKNYYELEKAVNDAECCCCFSSNTQKIDRVVKTIFNSLSLQFVCMAVSLLSFYKQSLKITRNKASKNNPMVIIAINLTKNKDEIIESINHFFPKHRDENIFEPLMKAAESVIVDSIKRHQKSNTSQNQAARIPLLVPSKPKIGNEAQRAD